VRGSVGKGGLPGGAQEEAIGKGKRLGRSHDGLVRVVFFSVSPFLLHVLGFRWAFLFFSSRHKRPN
jgi:hypothetical protein